MSKTMILRPRVSEKAYGLSQLRNTYVFVVPGSANKLMIAAAVAAQFNVTVEDVNVANVKGKVKRTVRKGGRATTGQDSNQNSEEGRHHCRLCVRRRPEGRRQKDRQG
jgi:ribosomal protein L23